MKNISYRLLLVGMLLFGSNVEGVLTTNSWFLFGGKWEDGTKWSAGSPSLLNAVNTITNDLSAITVTIDTTTVTQHVMALTSLTVSNLFLGRGSVITHTLFMNNANNTPGNIGLTILSNFTINATGILSITNSDLRVTNPTGGLFINGTALHNFGTITCTNLSVGRTGVGTMTVSNGTLITRNLNVAELSGSQGTFNIAGGSVTSRNMLVALSGLTGTVWMTGGQLTVSNESTALGDPGVGQMTVSNGTWAASIVSVRQGTLTIAGGTHKFYSLAIASGASTLTAAVWMVGGNVAITNTTTAFPGFTNGTAVGLNGFGQMTMSNGTFLGRDMYVGTNTGSVGTFTMAGGTNTLTSLLSVGGLPGATGAVWITGGRFAVTNNNTQIGVSGVGQITLSNGTWLARDVYVGVNASSRGTLTYAGGTNILSSVLQLGINSGVTGTLWMTDGRLVVTNVASSVIIGSSGVGQMAVSNGDWLAREVFIATNAGSAGTLNIAGGSGLVTSNMILGNFACSSTPIVNMTAGSLIVSNPNPVIAAKLEVRSGTFTHSGGDLVLRNLVITNACARFLHTGGTLKITGVLILDPNMDADGDGIPNNYELFSPVLFQLNPNDAGEDPDGDGFTNLEEYLNGTDPTVNDFHITAIAREGNDIRITWATVGGTTNRVLVSTGAAGGSFTNNFTNLSPRIFVAGTGATSTNYLDSGGATNTPARYYRVRRSLEPGGARFLFDAGHAQSAGNADWVVDADVRNIVWNSSGTFTTGGSDSNAQRIPTPPASGIISSTPETYWDGGISAWAVDLVKRGHSVETLPAGVQFTYGTANAQDLSNNYDVVVVDEPNILFTLVEKQALLSFVTNGGSLFMISDHTSSDRNSDGVDSPEIWMDFLTNNLVANNPFGIVFPSSSASGTNTFNHNIVGDPILNGPVGLATNTAYFAGNRFQIDHTKNPTVISHMWFGTAVDSNNLCAVASLRYGNGRVVVVGDSSPIEDGTGDPGDGLFNGYTGDLGETNRIWILNASEWLAAPFQ
jgi:hypothetical protein